MFGPRIALSVAFGLLTAAVVITLAGYYESPRLLLFQIALIAGPTIVPLMPLPRDGPAMVPGWVAVALLMSAGWAYVIYIDTQPYTGGGASFALLLGWFTCFVAGIVAVIISAVDSWRRRTR